MSSNYQDLFDANYSNMHVADQTICINNMVKYFLIEEIHNQYYITNITSHIVYHTYDIVKFLDKTDITTRLGYEYCTRVMKKMYKNFKQNAFGHHAEFIDEFKNLLDLEINNPNN